MNCHNFLQFCGRISGDELNRIIDRLKSASTLVLDDIDSFPERQSSGTSYWRNILFQILNVRYNERKDTIITSNFSENELSRLLTPHIYSAIIQTGGFIDTRTWKNYRIPNQSPIAKYTTSLKPTKPVQYPAFANRTSHNFIDTNVKNNNNC